jgi:hypothetical protein
LATEFGSDCRDVHGGGLPEQFGLDAVVGVDQNVSQADEAGPVDGRPGRSSFRSLCSGGFADDLDETFGDEAEVFVFNPRIEVDSESGGELLGGVEDVGDAVPRRLSSQGDGLGQDVPDGGSALTRWLWS